MNTEITDYAAAMERDCRNAVGDHAAYLRAKARYTALLTGWMSTYIPGRGWDGITAEESLMRIRTISRSFRLFGSQPWDLQFAMAKEDVLSSAQPQKLSSHKQVHLQKI